MGLWSTSSTLEADVPAHRIWTAAYADASAWPRWNAELAAAALDGELEPGAVARIRFRSGLRLRFCVTEFEPGRLFTDEARLPGARLSHRHLLDDLGEGRTRLVNTITISGPLSGPWVALAGRRAERALPGGQRAAVALAARADAGSASLRR